jgi:SpoVK/Ycf46/Vps4 family AAA+-type ATPase
LNETEPKNIEELKEEDKQLLKKIIEEKLGKNKLNELIEYKPINLEDVYKNIISLIQFHIMNNNSEENLNKDSSLLNKNKSFYYRHKGILLCGNSGIGKTHMFNCIKANYLKSENINYFDINIYKDLQIPDKSTNFIKSIFLFSKLLSPTVIFIENIDIIFPNNSSSNEDNSTINNSSEINPLLSEFILQMEKMSPNIILLASCEMTSKLNPILTKLGFFDYNISLPLPNYNQRKNIIEYILKDFKHNLQEIDINNLSDKSHGFVPGDFVKLFKEAFLKSELSQINIITKDLINNCLGDIKPINLKDIIIDVPRVKWEEIGGNKEIINKIRQSIEWPLKNPEAFNKHRMNSTKVAKIAYKKMMKNKRVINTGALAKFVCLFTRFLPRKFAAKCTAKANGK